MKTKNKTKADLKPLGAVIQSCPDCGVIDVWLNDGHFCNAQAEADRQENLEHYYN